MSNILKGIVALAVLAFILAVIGAFFNFSIIRVSPEAFSRACNNLALIAIALAVCFKEEAKG
jgi:cytochrome c biogenesis factor